MKLEFWKAKIEKERLMRTPISERAFYLKAMNFLTDVSILQKCCWHSIPQKDYAEALKMEAAKIQGVFFIRHLAGLLLEGYKLIQKGFLAKRLGQAYQIKELESIKEYFSKKDNLIKKIRNKFAYHLDTDSVSNELEQFPDNEELVIYLVKSITEWSNNFFQAGDDILISALVRLTGKSRR